MSSESEGNLLHDFSEHLVPGKLLVLMPIARVEVELPPLTYPGPVIFYPAGFANLDDLNIVPNNKEASTIADFASHASGITEETICQHSLVAFPYTLDWSEFRTGKHEYHRELIRTLSEHVDAACLNFIRYSQCPVDIHDYLPARAGQLGSNHMMAGAILYNYALREGRLIGGDAFTHFITRGLGLPLESIEHGEFPRTGEVGQIVSHALVLFRDMLEASSSTSKFIQCLGLLEFLADPDKFLNFDKVSGIVARYSTTNMTDYKKLLDRLFDLTGKKDGYRNRIVHMGQRLEGILPDHEDRRKLFRELSCYIGRIIDHMIIYSDKTFAEYLIVRDALRPFEVVR